MGLAGWSLPPMEIQRHFLQQEGRQGEFLEVVLGKKGRVWEFTSAKIFGVLLDPKASD